MTRKKVKLAWIMSNNARKASLKKRKAGLLKKVSELTILCGVKACVIMYSPDEKEPTVWPSPEMVRYLILQFRSMPEIDQVKKMMNQESYLKERFSKSQDQVTKCHKKNKQIEMSYLMYQIHQGRSLDELSIKEMSGLVWMLDEKMKMIRKRFEYNEQSPFVPSSGSIGQFPFPPEPEGPGIAVVDDTARLGSGFEPQPWDQWFMQEFVNNHEPKSVGTTSDMGFQYHPFASGVPVPDDHLGLPRFLFTGESSTVSADMGRVLPPPAPTNYNMPQPHGGVSEIGMGLPEGSSAGGQGSNFGSFGSYGEPGPNIFGFGGHIGTSSSVPAAAEHYYGLPPIGSFRDSTNVSSTSTNFVQPPFEYGKNWPNNFSH